MKEMDKERKADTKSLKILIYLYIIYSTCYGLSVPTPNPYIETLMPKITVLGGKAFGR